MTDSDLAALVANAYDSPTEIVAGDIGVLIQDGAVAIRGTVPWIVGSIIRDLEIAEIVSRDHPALGPCHDGCLRGAEATMALLSRDVHIVCGHSQGGGVAQLVAAMLVDQGRPPARLVTFGAMMVAASDRLPKMLTPIPGVHFCHAGDPIPRQPDLPENRFLSADLASYRPWRQPTMIGIAGSSILENHAVAAYRAALAQVDLKS